MWEACVEGEVVWAQLVISWYKGCGKWEIEVDPCIWLPTLPARLYPLSQPGCTHFASQTGMTQPTLPARLTLSWYPIIGAVLTQEEIDQLMGKLDRMTTTLQEKEKAKLKERKVSS